MFTAEKTKNDHLSDTVKVNKSKQVLTKEQSEQTLWGLQVRIKGEGCEYFFEILNVLI